LHIFGGEACFIACDYNLVFEASNVQKRFINVIVIVVCVLYGFVDEVPGLRVVVGDAKEISRCQVVCEGDLTF
jgi:hypothetical protein